MTSDLGVGTPAPPTDDAYGDRRSGDVTERPPSAAPQSHVDTRPAPRPARSTARHATPVARLLFGPLASTLGMIAAAVLLGAAMAAILASSSGSGHGPSRNVLLYPAIPVAGILIVGLAIVRFEALVLLLLTFRNALDYFKGAYSAGAGSSTLTVIVAGVLVLAGLVWLSAQRRQQRLRAADMPISIAASVLLGASLISTIASVDVSVSAPEWTRLAAVVMMIAVLERLFRNPLAIRRALIAVYCSLPIPAALAIMQKYNGSGESIDGVRRSYGTFVHPNSLAMYLGFLIVMAVALVSRVAGRVRLGLIAVLALALPALLFTGTRGAWVGTSIGLLLVCFLRSGKLVLGAIVAGVTLVAVDSSIAARFSDLGNGTKPSGVPGNSLTWRFDQWREALHLVSGRYITGLGPAIVRDETTKATHNDYLRAFVEGGLLGALAYLGLVITLVIVARRAWQRATDPFSKAVAAGCAGCVTSFMVMSTADNLITQSVVLWYFAVFVAAGSAIARRPLPPPLPPAETVPATAGEDRVHALA